MVVSCPSVGTRFTTFVFPVEAKASFLKIIKSGSFAGLGSQSRRSPSWRAELSSMRIAAGLRGRVFDHHPDMGHARF